MAEDEHDYKGVPVDRFCRPPWTWKRPNPIVLA
jgi:hypothetical protein